MKAKSWKPNAVCCVNSPESKGSCLCPPRYEVNKIHGVHGEDSAPYAFRTGKVAQVSQPAVSPTSSRQALNFAALADWKSATQQTGSLRYGAREVSAAVTFDRHHQSHPGSCLALNF